MRLRVCSSISVAMFLVQCCAIGRSAAYNNSHTKNESSLLWLTNLQREISSEVVLALKCVVGVLEDSQCQGEMSSRRKRSSSPPETIRAQKNTSLTGLQREQDNDTHHDYHDYHDHRDHYHDVHHGHHGHHSHHSHHGHHDHHDHHHHHHDSDEEEEIDEYDYEKKPSLKGRRKNKEGYLIIPAVLGLAALVIATIVGITGLVAGKALALSFLALVITVALSARVAAASSDSGTGSTVQVRDVYPETFEYGYRRRDYALPKDTYAYRSYVRPAG